MAMCAMIGQLVIKIKSGATGRLSSLVAGLFLLFLIIALGDVLAWIPMAALVGVVIMVALSTFDWKSVRDLPKVPASDASIMVITIAIVVFTHDLAQEVIAGVVLSALVFGWRISAIHATGTVWDEEVKIYTVKGQVFFGTTAAFIDLFDYMNDPQRMEIDLTHSHIWDQSAIAPIVKVVDKYQPQGKTVYVTGLNPESQETLEKGFS